MYSVVRHCVQKLNRLPKTGFSIFKKTLNGFVVLQHEKFIWVVTKDLLKVIFIFRKKTIRRNFFMSVFKEIDWYLNFFLLDYLNYSMFWFCLTIWLEFCFICKKKLRLKLTVLKRTVYEKTILRILEMEKLSLITNKTVLLFCVIILILDLFV